SPTRKPATNLTVSSDPQRDAESQDTEVHERVRGAPGPRLRRHHGLRPRRPEARPRLGRPAAPHTCEWGPLGAPASVEAGRAAGYGTTSHGTDAGRAPQVHADRPQVQRRQAVAGSASVP